MQLAKPCPVICGGCTIKDEEQRDFLNRSLSLSGVTQRLWPEKQPVARVVPMLLLQEIKDRLAKLALPPQLLARTV
jgi:hypothetical protein